MSFIITNYFPENDIEVMGSAISIQLNHYSIEKNSDNEQEDEGDVDTEDLNLESITSDESVDINQYEQQPEEVEETETVATGLSAEMSLREKLLAKCNMSTRYTRNVYFLENILSFRQSPDAAAQVSSSSERAETCRNLLLSTCKFGYNGTCAKGRECT